jgi:hypothetical protein
MSLNIIIGSDPADVERLAHIKTLLRWSANACEADPDLSDFTSDQIENLYNWVDGLHSLLTDMSVFINDDNIDDDDLQISIES